MSNPVYRFRYFSEQSYTVRRQSINVLMVNLQATAFILLFANARKYTYMWCHWVWDWGSDRLTLIAKDIVGKMFL